MTDFRHHIVSVYGKNADHSAMQGTAG